MVAKGRLGDWRGKWEVREGKREVREGKCEEKV